MSIPLTTRVIRISKKRHVLVAAFGGSTLRNSRTFVSHLKGLVSLVNSYATLPIVQGNLFRGKCLWKTATVLANVFQVAKFQDPHDPLGLISLLDNPCDASRGPFHPSCKPYSRTTRISRKRHVSVAVPISMSRNSGIFGARRTLSTGGSKGRARNER